MHIYRSSARLEAAKTRSSMQLDVNISLSRQMAVNAPYNLQWVSEESYVTNSLLPVTGNL
jgi:hypothetical protein